MLLVFTHKPPIIILLVITKLSFGPPIYICKLSLNGLSLNGLLLLAPSLSAPLLKGLFESSLCSMQSPDPGGGAESNTELSEGQQCLQGPLSLKSFDISHASFGSIF